MKRMMISALAVLGFTAAAHAAVSGVYITEWMYKPSDGSTTGFGEFAEITNVGGSPVSLAGWSFSDSGELPGATDLTSIGTLQPGQSAIITDDTVDDFRAIWNLPASVPVVGGNQANLGKADEINIYDAGSNLVDHLTYDSSVDPATSGASASVPASALGQSNNASSAILSTVGDAFGSTTSTQGDIANPGIYISGSTVPEPASIGILVIGSLGLLARRGK